MEVNQLQFVHVQCKRVLALIVVCVCVFCSE